MNDTRRMFEEYAEAYDAGLRKGLSVSGEDKTYFARGRISWTGRRLMLQGCEPKQVMDFGCGIGDSAPLLKDIEGMTRIVGTDISPMAIETAQSLFPGDGIEFEVIDVSRPPDSTFDLVYCNGVFHHVRREEREAAVRWIYTSLRPGGFFALWENNPWNPATRYVMSRIPFDRDAITLSSIEAGQLLRSQGFDVVEKRFMFIFPRPLRLFRILEPLLSPLPMGTQYMVLARKPDVARS